MELRVTDGRTDGRTAMTTCKERRAGKELQWSPLILSTVIRAFSLKGQFLTGPNLIFLYYLVYKVSPPIGSTFLGQNVDPKSGL